MKNHPNLPRSPMNEERTVVILSYGQGNNPRAISQDKRADELGGARSAPPSAWALKHCAVPPCSSDGGTSSKPAAKRHHCPSDRPVHPSTSPEPRSLLSCTLFVSLCITRLFLPS